jgi:group II intron reverse transcriptase/maturase
MKQMRIAQLAVEGPKMVFTTLAHHIDVDWLREAYRQTRKSGAVGVDGQTAQEYAANLEENLRSLLERFKSGSYFAPPVRRVHIPKGDGKQTRPIGIPAFEDKVLQRAVVMVLEPIYERDFLNCSYGFRPGRSAHMALEDFRERSRKMRGGWVLELDIRKFFDELGHEHLRQILHRRIGDGVLLRTIGKWLNAGVNEAGCLSYPESGSPQGGVISPILANAYLHEVLDEWFESTVKPRLKSEAFMVRFADDAVLVFKEEHDARRVMEVLPKRFGKYGLRLHPEKTRLVRFERPRYRGKDDRNDKPGTFDLLGFTHYWAVSRKGNWVIKRKTARKRLTRTLKALSEWCRINRHRPIKEQWQELKRKLSGHYGYYGIIGNSRLIQRVDYWAQRIWRKWLSRRSQRAFMPWAIFRKILACYPLPRPTIRQQVTPLAMS